MSVTACAEDGVVRHAFTIISPVDSNARDVDADDQPLERFGTPRTNDNKTGK